MNYWLVYRRNLSGFDEYYHLKRFYFYFHCSCSGFVIGPVTYTVRPGSEINFVSAQVLIFFSGQERPLGVF